MFPNETKVYVPLKNEGTDVCRPTRTVACGGMRFELLATDDYDPEDEVWKFPPGSVVVCRVEHLGGIMALVARDLAA